MTMIEIYRFSKTGFEPQFQDHLYRAYHQKIDNIDVSRMNDYQVRLISESLSIPVDPSFCFHGFFAFLNKPNYQDYRFYMNHLNEKDRPDYNHDCHSMMIDAERLCYLDGGFCYHLVNKTTAINALKNQYKTVYIPVFD
jgi:hypothetical protein